MGTRLRKLKKSLNRKKLSDSKTIYAGSVTKLLISFRDIMAQQLESIQTISKILKKQFGQLISTNFPHKRSQYITYDPPPPGPDTWCKYRKAELTGDFHSHEYSIPEAVMLVVKPVYRDLAHPDLLRKLIHGKTQNSNELPKNVVVGLKTLQWGVNEGVISLNEGNFGRLTVLQEIDIWT
ncbi:hypothetical protein PR048_012384, partial [Dryococelus australis]